MESREAPRTSSITLSSRITKDLEDESLDGYQEWNTALYAEDIFRRFGTLTIVEPTLIPVGMVSVFKNSKISVGLIRRRNKRNALSVVRMICTIAFVGVHRLASQSLLPRF